MTFHSTTLTVSQLNRQIRGFLENDIGTVHVEGEISNLAQPSSGHFYFTLKDSSAQLRCVFFKNRHLNRTTPLKEGQHIVARGQLSLYEARGDYQLIVASVIDAGLGQLYKQFEQLKEKLAAEGLFDSQRKKPLPPYPKTIGVITSSTGAAIHDILSTLKRRYPLAKILIFPSDVQGAQAAPQLINAISLAERDHRSDVLILARGGGSLEDLWAFNHELLARTIAACSIPIVSGVGHETDFTIADFVADLRAATPTAAAESVTPNAIELINTFNHFYQQLFLSISRRIHHDQLSLNHLQQKISSPEQLILSHWQTLDYQERRLQNSLHKALEIKKHRMYMLLSQLHSHNPKTVIHHTSSKLDALKMRLVQQLRNQIYTLKLNLSKQATTLHAVSPLATLDRGYAIATLNHTVLYSSEKTAPGDVIDVRLSKGLLTCEILKIGD